MQLRYSVFGKDNLPVNIAKLIFTISPILLPRRPIASIRPATAQPPGKLLPRHNTQNANLDTACVPKAHYSKICRQSSAARMMIKPWQQIAKTRHSTPVLFLYRLRQISQANYAGQ